MKNEDPTVCAQAVTKIWQRKTDSERAHEGFQAGNNKPVARSLKRAGEPVKKNQQRWNKIVRPDQDGNEKSGWILQIWRHHEE
jgi:hypothetical protein